MKDDIPHILFVNPWIHDFAAYDVWAKPYGLLSLAAIVRHHGYRVSYIDCLNRFHKNEPPKDPTLRNGRGPYPKNEISKPDKLEDINRTFSRYGISPEWFKKDLESIPNPDLILVTSMMTYWASGVTETISMIKNIFKDVPVILGGIYATLCYDHAIHQSGADRVITGYAENNILDLVSEYTGYKESCNYNPEDIDTYPYPAFDLQSEIGYIPLLTSRGCPYSCEYCASSYLYPGINYRDPELVVEEIKFWSKRHGVKNFAFYDDALLIHADKHANIIFENIINENLDVQFHVPNALHIREITEETANLMLLSGFKTLRLGLETVDFDTRKKNLDRKVTEAEFNKAVNHLLKAGFHKNQIGAYLLTGFPGQTTRSIENSITTVLKKGITPILSYYTPIPHTSMWEKAVSSSRYNLLEDPVYSNNAIFPCQDKPFSWQEITRLKNMIKQKA